MNIETANLEELTWYRDYLIGELEQPQDLEALAYAGVPYADFIALQQYMKGRLAKVEARIATLMA
jgi:hypothetical protein